ncbi:SDR family NAD(P)-dependent oxidoreductase [Acidocella sp.]|uniref:SDR family NAD(P)-dependent oxidoreductase n=1 Tax=Acidocella sp. TaxID=50710 RepID=UPI003D04D83D
MKNTHEGRVALVTGAAKGIGQEICIRLAERGATVVLVDLEDPAETASLIGGNPLRLTGDVSNAESWVQFARLTDERYGRADIVVNNAGIYPFAEIDDLTYEIWSKTLRVNLDAHFYSAKSFVPLMRRNQWGRFVNTSSNSIGTPLAGLSHYMAAKMGVIGFVRGLANDLAKDKITVNAILPAITKTPGTSGMPDEMIRTVWEQQAIKRFAEPSDIVGPILFLTSDDATFVTGQAIVADGGMYKVS